MTETKTQRCFTDLEKLLLIACRDFIKGYAHFLNCIDFNHSYLDSEAIGWMNTAPGKIQEAIDEAEKEFLK